MGGEPQSYTSTHHTQTTTFQSNGMEPRIATLLDHTSDHITPDTTLSLPSIRRPLPVEPSPVGDDARSTRRSEYENLVNEHYSSANWHTQPRPDPASATESRFSGRLSDILLDPSKQDPLNEQQHPNKRRKVDEHGGENERNALKGGENERNALKLPKLPQLPKKVSRRPRIPPLLQGLHQPPPLPPEGRLFPPITGEAGGFGRGIGERVLGRADEERNRGKEEGGNAAASNGNIVDKNQGKERSPEAGPPNDKENEVQGRGLHEEPKGGKQVKRNKKRNKWSEQETKDLLHGVSRFGIGSWKKILECEEFHFDGRTAVDLKDRFRTCRPGDGLKARKPKVKAGLEENDAPEKEKEKGNQDGVLMVSGGGEGPSRGNVTTTESALKKKQSRKPRADTHKKGAAELAEMGIEGPFEPSKRRQRREFTDEDDENLLKGFQKHKATWHAIRDDQDLGFGSRHPTDLRDRFRIRYPEMYQKAGFKLKPKEELMFPKEKTEADSQAPQGELSDSQNHTAPAEGVAPLTKTAPPSNLHAHALRKPLLNSFPSLFEDFPSLDSEDDDEPGSHSPVTLNRNIFQWADANPSQTNMTAAPGYLTTGDAGFNLFAGMDGSHINPLATLKLPSASLSNNTLAAMQSYPPTSNPLMLSFPSRETTQGNMSISMLNTAINVSTPSTSTGTSAPSTSMKQTMASLLRTPNLPTIVYPHVPASSARNTMHNLPPPADLLSGLDLDIRADDNTRNTVHNLPPPADLLSGLDLDVGQHSSYFLDEGLGYASNATLAPLMGQRGRF
jgi:hypothetical protein